MALRDGMQHSQRYRFVYNDNVALGLDGECIWDAWEGWIPRLDWRWI